MSITTTTYSLMGVRRDGQIGSISSGGGGGSSVGSSSTASGGVDGGTTYFAGTNISLSGTTFNVIDAPVFTGNVSAPKFVESGTCLQAKYLGINACAYDSARLGTQLPAYYAPIDSPSFVHCTTSPISISTTCATTPLLCATNITLACNEGTASFTSGFAGAGWLMCNNSSSYELTVDTLTVRKMLKAYELQISKLSAINGGMIISVAAAKSTTFAGTNIYIDTNSGHNPIQFIVGDFVRAQQYDNGILYFQGQVTGVSSDHITVSVTTGSIYNNMDLVQVGHPTDVTRQSIIYLTASDTNNPYIDMLAGVNDGSFAGKQVIRLGNLAGIVDTAFSPSALSGAGLYATNVYLRGKIIATTGEFQSSCADYCGMCSSVKLCGADIWENNYNGDNSTLWLNRIGYQGGCSEFRNTAIGDGKGNSLVVFSKEQDNFWSLVRLNCGVEAFCGGELMGGFCFGCGNMVGCSACAVALDFVQNSDCRIKTCIQSLSVAPIDVDYKQFRMCADPDQVRYGVIAQDLQEKYPEMVHADEKGELSVSYNDLYAREIASLKCCVKQLSLDLNYMRNYNC